MVDITTNYENKFFYIKINKKKRFISMNKYKASTHSIISLSSFPVSRNGHLVLH